MVDVKRVTAVITNNTFKENIQADSPVGGEYVNFSPSSAVIIDPFAIFIQEDSKLKVKIPFTRFYKVKYTIFPYQTTVGGDNSQVSAWRSYVAFTNAIKLMKYSSVTNTESEVVTGIYKQDAVCFHSVIPTSSTTQKTTSSFVSGIVEGIVELNAGDTLQFKYELVLGKKTFYTGLTMTQDPGYVSTANLQRIAGEPVGVYPSTDVGPVYWSNIGLNLGPISFYDIKPFGTINNAAFSAYFGFFFEISEITDL
jgi:hypothetical protein